MPYPFCYPNLLLTLAKIVTLDTITEFESLVDTSGSTGGDIGAEDTLGGGDLNFDGGVTTRIEDLASVNFSDRRHI
jgi:hypothetical protein